MRKRISMPDRDFMKAAKSAAKSGQSLRATALGAGVSLQTYKNHLMDVAMRLQEAPPNFPKGRRTRMKEHISEIRNPEGWETEQCYQASVAPRLQERVFAPALCFPLTSDCFGTPVGLLSFTVLHAWHVLRCARGRRGALGALQPNLASAPPTYPTSRCKDPPVDSRNEHLGN